MQTREIITRAVLAYRQEYPGATKAEIATACGVTREEVSLILSLRRIVIELEYLDWSPSTRVKTRFGERDLRTAPPTASFWKKWHEDKESLKDAGFSVSRKDEVWQVCHWAEVVERNE